MPTLDTIPQGRENAHHMSIIGNIRIHKCWLLVVSNYSKCSKENSSGELQAQSFICASRQAVMQILQCFNLKGLGDGVVTST